MSILTLGNAHSSRMRAFLPLCPSRTHSAATEGYLCNCMDSFKAGRLAISGLFLDPLS